MDKSQSFSSFLINNMIQEKYKDQVDVYKCEVYRTLTIGDKYILDNLKLYSKTFIKDIVVLIR